jgi:hypothetical protein
VWVAVATDSLVILVVAAARVHSVVDVILGVAVIAANGAVGLALEDVGGWRKGRGEDSGAEEAKKEERLGAISGEWA